MSESNFWTRRVTQRVNRRRLLVTGAVGGVGIATAAAIGCGDDDGEQPALGTPAASSGQPKRGGVFRVANSSPMASLDPNRSTGGGTLSPLDYSYARLFRIASGPGKPHLVSEVEPDLVKSYEVSPDNLVYTMKLRENVKFHPPVSRNLTADDVVWSFDRFRGTLPGGQPAAESLRLDFVKSLEKIDSSTIRFTLNSPLGTFPVRLANMHGLIIFPKESDPSKAVIGTGAWLFDEHITGSVVKFRRNPEWHWGPDVPYMDRVEQYVIPEAATRLSQFLGGNLDYLTGVTPGDLKRVLDAVKGVQLGIYPGSGNPLYVIAFSSLPGTPWRDPRVRQALSMVMDRDATMEAAFNPKSLESLGVKVPQGWNNFVPTAYEDYWLDPRGNKMDPNGARYFKYDPEGAKKLLAEAGYPNGFRANFYVANLSSPDFQTIAELFVQYAGRIGVTLTHTPIDYNTVYAPKTRAGDHDGLAYIIVGGEADPEGYLAQLFTKGGPRNSSQVDDPALEAKFKAILANPNQAARRQAIIDLQTKELPEKMYYIPTQGGAGVTIQAYQPYIRGGLDYHSTVPSGEVEGGRNVPYHWIDK